MRCATLCSLVGLFGLAAPALAQVTVVAPYVRVDVGRGGVLVQTPWVVVDVGGPAAPAMPRAVKRAALTDTPPPLPKEPEPIPVPKRGDPTPTVRARPMTLTEFATTFEPRPGTYEVDLIHPGTGNAIRVAFTLPEGTPRKVRLKRREIDFDYGKQTVSIRFLIGGRVRVQY
jgi:hypothetical protein